MSKLDSVKRIYILNYNDNCVCVNVAPKTSVKIEPAQNGQPSSFPMTLDEIRFANNSSVFKDGVLEFEADFENELYEELHIDKNNVLKLSEIRDILLNPTKDGLTKLVSITNLSNFDRVRGQFQKLKYEGHKLTLDIADIIDRRTKELFNNQVRSDIQIDYATNNTNDSKRVAELERQVQEQMAMIQELLKAQNGDTSDEDAQSDVVQKKKAGRPKKSTV